jgi:hypothetical protein
VSHPSLGLAPRDHDAGDPVSGAALVAQRHRIAERALEFAADADPTFRERYTGVELTDLGLDLDSIVVRLAESVSSDNAGAMARWAEMVAVRYRKRSVPMDDLVSLFEGLRRAAPAAVASSSMPLVDAAVDAAIAVFRWHRRLGGDARRRNPFLWFIYKGA